MYDKAFSEHITHDITFYIDDVKKDAITYLDSSSCICSPLRNKPPAWLIIFCCSYLVCVFWDFARCLSRAVILTWQHWSFFLLSRWIFWDVTWKKWKQEVKSGFEWQNFIDAIHTNRVTCDVSLWKRIMASCIILWVLGWIWFSKLWVCCCVWRHT